MNSDNERDLLMWFTEKKRHFNVVYWQKSALKTQLSIKKDI